MQCIFNCSSKPVRTSYNTRSNQTRQRQLTDGSSCSPFHEWSFPTLTSTEQDGKDKDMRPKPKPYDNALPLYTAPNGKNY
jgi:hypothetical protein